MPPNRKITPHGIMVRQKTEAPMNKTAIETTTHLSKTQEEMIQELCLKCRAQDGASLSYPFEEAAQHLMSLLPDGRLAGVLALVPLEENLFECAAFTDPDFRRQGIFSGLLTHALEALDETDLLFQIPEACESAKEVMNHLQAEKTSTEYQMELILSARPNPVPSQENGFSLVPIQNTDEGETQIQFCQNHQAVGSCKLYSMSGHAVCLHHVEIADPLRGQGLGSRFLALLLTFLSENNIRKVLLHVASDNLPALSLYEKAGFRITETLHCYLY